jgi:hypothetical protein
MQVAQEISCRSVLIVGNPALPLKGFPTAIAALTILARLMPIKVRTSETPMHGFNQAHW